MWLPWSCPRLLEWMFILVGAWGIWQAAPNSDTQFNPREASLAAGQGRATHHIQNRPLFTHLLSGSCSFSPPLLQAVLQVRLLKRKKMGRCPFPPCDSFLEVPLVQWNRLNTAQSCKRQVRARLLTFPLGRCIRWGCHAERLLLFLPHADYNCTWSCIPI